VGFLYEGEKVTSMMKKSKRVLGFFIFSMLFVLGSAEGQAVQAVQGEQKAERPGGFFGSPTIACSSCSGASTCAAPVTCVCDLCPVLNSLETIEDKLDDCCETTHSLLSKIEMDISEIECDGAPKGNVITGPTFSITEGGLYVLTANTDSCVTINADKVTIDMCGFTLFCDSEDAVIEILTGNKNIEIKNGKIEGDLTTDGILTNSLCKLVNIENIKILSCNNGINFNGQNGEIKCCEVANCTFTECNKGAHLNHAKKCVFERCKACCCVLAGFELFFSDFNRFYKCEAIETENDDLDLDAIGFSSFAGRGNLFKECVAEGTRKTESNFGTKAVGFLLTGTEGVDGMERETKIIDCIANSTEVNLTGSGCAYGIKLEPFILSDALTTFTGTDYGVTLGVNSVDWSPDGRFLAIGGNGPADPGNEIQVFSFDGTSLSLTASFNYSDSSATKVNEINWSPCGRFLAVGGLFPGGLNDEIEVFSFDGSSLSLLTGTVTPFGLLVNSVNWSPCGRYLAVGGRDPEGAAGDEIQVFSFDGSSLSLLDGINYGADGPDTIIVSVDWSPCGRFLAVGGDEWFEFNAISAAAAG